MKASTFELSRPVKESARYCPCPVDWSISLLFKVETETGLVGHDPHEYGDCGGYPLRSVSGQLLDFFKLSSNIKREYFVLRLHHGSQIFSVTTFKCEMTSFFIWQSCEHHMLVRRTRLQRLHICLNRYDDIRTCSVLVRADSGAVRPGGAWTNKRPRAAAEN